MKNLSFLFCFIFSAQVACANKIDELKTDSDLIQFLKPLIEKKYEPTKVRSLQIEHWRTLDLNSDKRTDLLALIKWNDSTYPTDLIVIDKGNTFQLIVLRIGEEGKLTNIIEPKDTQPLIVYSSAQYFQKENREYQKIIRLDTLIYKYGGFVELNKRPSRYQIDSIIYWQSGCFGDCPSFKVRIDRQGNASYERKNTVSRSLAYPGGKAYTGKPVVKSVINKNKLQEICDLMGYINLKKLQDNYAVDWTDLATYTVTVKFRDGTVKIISDYGAQGTFGLMALYENFML